MLIHCCASIEGMLNNFKKPGSLDGILTEGKTGRSISDAEARAYLNGCLEKGWKVIPTEGCDNFDYQTGCKGHPSKEASNDIEEQKQQASNNSHSSSTKKSTAEI